jgi:D-sedoheptulose 7-phosphate isomerase
MTVEQIFAEHAEVIRQAALELPRTLEQITARVFQTLHSGCKVFACGNGGSAADAQHFVAELVGRFRDDRRALAAIALTADTAILTAVGNDYGYERVFARQLEALARHGDLLFAISTSGNSPNVVQAALTARGLGCTVVALTGAAGGDLSAHADLIVRAPSKITARIQEVHTLCIHAIADGLDALIRSPEKTSV